MSARQTDNHAQHQAIINGIACFILMLLMCQIWLVTATVQAFLGGDHSIVVPAAIASFLCLLLNLGLLRYLFRIQKPS